MRSIVYATTHPSSTLHGRLWINIIIIILSLKCETEEDHLSSSDDDDDDVGGLKYYYYLHRAFYDLYLGHIYYTLVFGHQQQQLRPRETHHRSIS